VKKYLKVLLVLFMLVTSIPFYGQGSMNVSAEEMIEETKNVSLLYEGNEINSVILKQEEKKEIAVDYKSDTATYQWQLYFNDYNEWIDINDMTSEICMISYSLLESALDYNGTARIRCQVVDEEDLFYSNEAKITISFNVLSTPNSDNVSVASIANDEISVFALQRANEYVTIEIKYVYEDLTKAFDSYTAYLQAGTHFGATVPSPSIVGYSPFIQETNEDATEVVLNYPSVDEDTVITVVYKPTTVSYRVRYYLQNVSDDLYTEDSALSSGTYEGITGSYPPNDVVKMPINGFSALYYEPERIAADGSTEFYSYYDRNYYLLYFDCNEGYGVEPLYARYGTPFVTNTPVRHGYVFVGWDLEKDGKYDGKVDTLPDTVPYEDQTYRAIWKTVETSYTIVYWRENADDEGYSYWGSEVKGKRANGTYDGSVYSATYVDGTNSIPSSITTTEIDGKNVDEIVYFKYNDSLTDKHVIVEGDGSTVVNVYYDRNSYTIRFRISGLGTTAGLGSHTHGDGTCDIVTCPIEAHTHSDECNPKTICGLENHIHTNECLICGEIEHTHSPSCCTLEECNHTTDCYKLSGGYGVYWGDRVTDTSTINSIQNSTNISDSGIVRTGSNYGNYKYYYKIGDDWYEIRNVWDWRNVTVTLDCPNHVHDGVDCNYCSLGLDEHIHSEACYKDVEHTHDEYCYEYECGKEEHTHDSMCSPECSKPEYGINGNYYEITAKYNQTVGHIWPTAANFPNVEFHGWTIDSVSSTAVSKRVNMTTDLCDTTDFIKYATSNTGGNKRYLYYMFESIDQSSPANGDDRKLRNGIYYDKSELYFQEVYSSGNFGQKEILGMTPVSSGVNYDGSNIFLYYTRNRYTLSFQNIDEIVKTVNQVMYQYPLREYGYVADANGIESIYVPEYPDKLEPNAYHFDGWYRTPECFKGTEVDFNTLTMPESNLALYAKWSPNTHEVKFYNSYADIANGTQLGNTFVVEHGEVIEGEIPTPNKEGFNFKGWFYMVDGEKIAYHPYEIPVKKDLYVYAEWESTEVVEYTIDYYAVYTDEDDVEIKREKMASQTNGKTFAGQTKTFQAKTGADVYEAYREGWYPRTNSHSIVMAKPTDDNPTPNTYTFEYIKLDQVPYTVRYVDKENGTILSEEKYVGDNKKQVVTEKFVPILGYLPDAYYKRLVLSANPAENIITFYYVPDTTHAYYVVHHYIQSVDNPLEYDDYAIIEGIGDLDKEVNADALTISGFTFNPTKTLGEANNEETSPGSGVYLDNYEVVGNQGVKGTITAEGLQLELYYDRNKYDYTVKYLKYGTTNENIFEPKVVQDVPYGSTVTESAEAIVVKNIDGVDVTYNLVSEQTKDLIIRDDESQNVLIFYYEEKTYAIRYVPICFEQTTDFGGVTLGLELVKTASAIQGSTPIPNANFEFVGWYLDAECTHSVTDEDGTIDSVTNYFKPSKVSDSVYYALFKPIEASLKIEKTGVNSNDLNQNFLFKVTGLGANNSYVSQIVSIQGNGEVTIDHLPLGEYKITELTDWSWRYSVDGNTEQTVELVIKDTTYNVEYKNNLANDNWLGDEVSKDNRFNKID